MKYVLLLLAAFAACFWFGCAAGVISYSPWVVTAAFAFLGIGSLLDFLKQAFRLSEDQ